MTTESQQMLDQTRRLANDAMERANSRLKDVGGTVQSLANRGLNTVGDSALAAQRHLTDYARTSGRYVADHPMKSALIAAAVGAAVAGLIIALRNRSHRDY